MSSRHAPAGRQPRASQFPERRYLGLHLPWWATQYLMRADPQLKAPLVLYEKIKGGLRLAALDPEAAREGLRVGQALADARALLPGLTVLEQNQVLLVSAFAGFDMIRAAYAHAIKERYRFFSYGDAMLLTRT